jgi:hypothetical protein
MTLDQKSQNFIRAIEAKGNVTFTPKYAEVFTSRIKRSLEDYNKPEYKHLVFEDYNFTGDPEDFYFDIYNSNSSTKEIYANYMEDSFDEEDEEEERTALGFIDLETGDYKKLLSDGTLVNYNEYTETEDSFANLGLALDRFNYFNAQDSFETEDDFDF